jgi:hypothetical protein
MAIFKFLVSIKIKGKVVAHKSELKSGASQIAEKQQKLTRNGAILNELDYF